MVAKSQEAEIFSQPYFVKSPVLLIAFNRPSETLEVIARLRDVKPKKLYFSVDGPRPSRASDIVFVEETKNLVSQIDWECEVVTRFLNKNMGCGEGVSSAISWALEEEDNLIILEDDIVPQLSFFRFCDELLDRYRDDDDVFAISGSNFVPIRMVDPAESYRFSSIPHVWGWATWKSSWTRYSFDITNWRKELSLKELREALGGSRVSTFLWAKLFDLVATKKVDTWDYQLFYAIIKTRTKVATANINLTENIGFGENATHTAVAPTHVLAAGHMNFPLLHPADTRVSKLDYWTQSNVMGANVIDVSRGAIKYFKARISSPISRRT